MTVLIILLIISISIAVGFLCLFIWTVNDGQYDDLEGPAQRIFIDKN